MKSKVCCFTGHRPEGFFFAYDEKNIECLRIKARLREEIEKMITENGVKCFISGMAQGVDTWAAETVLELKVTYPDISLIAAIPCPNQTKSWSEAACTRYKKILSGCDEKTTVSMNYTPYCMMKRNTFMVDNSDYVLAVWNGKRTGGTAKTVEYARKKEKITVVIGC